MSCIELNYRQDLRTEKIVTILHSELFMIQSHRNSNKQSHDFARYGYAILNAF